MQTILTRLAGQFDPSFIAQRVAMWLPNVVVAIITLMVFWLLNRAAKQAVRFVMEKAEIDRTAVSFVQNLLQYGLFTIALITALGQLGIDVTSLVASLGVAGLTIGFAARDALSNIISGVFIFWDRPFVIGDLVEIGSVYGQVHEITMRSTRIVTPDGRMLAVPNSVIVNGPVASYTNFPSLRLEVDVTIGVNESIDRAREVFLDLVEGDPQYMTEPAPAMVVTALNDYNIAVQYRVWIKDEKEHIASRFALREHMYKALVNAGVEMPFETLQIEPLTLRKAT